MISIISLFLELLFIQFIPNNSYIIPLFTLVSLFYLKKDNKYYILLFLLGFLYDLFFTNIIFLHSIIFLLLGFIIKIINKKILSVILRITIYNILIFIFYKIFNNISINLIELLFIISHYYIINIIYYYTLRIIIKNNHNI